jgi:hypothetical protein
VLGLRILKCSGSISLNGRLFIGATLCKGGAHEPTAKSQNKLETGIYGKSMISLNTHIIVADPAKQGI